MEIDSFKIMQDGLRYFEDVIRMVDYVNNGGIFSESFIESHLGHKAPLIAITRFEDGTLILHDGHHRVAAICLSSKRNFLYESEYFIQEMSYDFYNQVGFKVGWVTPFDPRFFVRIPDFKQFKQKVLKMYTYNQTEAEKYIYSNASEYLKLRSSKHDHIKGILTDIEIFQDLLKKEDVILK